jgi:16S rRNA (adenine1518-N6/adenine1519-N6)-dimethyltransferase
MIESSLFQRMVGYASLNQDDTVLDVGAGLGFLTGFMSGGCRTVLAVEADAKLASVLREQLVDVPNAKVVEGDVLKVEVPPFNKVVSVPPYQISSPLLLWLFDRGFDTAVLVFQKEFARRLVASVGTEDYGWLTVVTYYHAEAELLDKVPKWMFYPQPKIDSVIVRLNFKEPRPFTVRNRTLFKRLVQSSFTKRNKKVKNAVLPYVKGFCAMPEEEAVRIAESLPFRDKRVRELAPEDFGVLADVLIR